MGLDWNPLGKPKPGDEATFYGFLGANGSADRWMQPSGLHHGESLFSQAVTSEDYFAAQISPYETLAAPKVGHDLIANEWILDQYDNAVAKPPTKEEWLASFSGYYVLDLVLENDGLPIYSNWSAGNQWERWSFRAQFFVDCESALGERLFNEAWLHHMPAQLATYSEQLMVCAKKYAVSNGVEHALGDRDIPDMGEEHCSRPEHIAHVIASAARWTKFWSDRGHGMEADF
jgi:hypothetical protein